MYDVHELEKQWEMYHKKRNRPKYVIIGTSLLLVSIGVFLYNVKDEILAVLDVNQTSFQVLKPIDKLETKLLEQNKTVVVENNISKQNIIKVIEEKPYDKAGNMPVLEEVESLEPDMSISAQDTTAASEHRKVKLQINVVDASSVTTFQEIEKRFYESGDLDDALFLARNYFDNKNYKKSEYWALQANKIDENNEEAWLVFAESKYALGNKTDAINVLESYLEKKDSLHARQLLKKFKGQ